MGVAIALWSYTVSPGESSVITPPADLRITNVALGDKVEDETSRTTVKLIFHPLGEAADSEDEEADEEEASPKISTAVLCSLTYGKIEQTTVDVILSEDEEYLFEVVGKNTVHLTGNYIDQSPSDMPDDDDETEDEFDLQDVSSDVEIDPRELDIPSDDDEGRFEEVEDVEVAPKETSKKRPRESDVTETGEQEKLSKSQKKKQKKLKGANGEAVEAPTPEKAEKAADKKDKKAKDKDDRKKAETKVLRGGVKITDHKVGEGKQAKAGDTLSMRYIGKLENGEVFDSNTKGSPFKFHLGKGEVIKGWDVGIVGMQVGGERLLSIPAPMGYGKKGQPGAGIPGNSTLIFEIKLIEIK